MYKISSSVTTLLSPSSDLGSAADGIRFPEPEITSFKRPSIPSDFAWTFVEASCLPNARTQ